MADHEVIRMVVPFPQPRGAVREFTGSRTPVNAVAFSPDGRLLAAGSRDQVVRLWDVDGTPRGKMTAHRFAVRHVRFSPTGTVIASIGMQRSVSQRRARLDAFVWDHASDRFRPLDIDCKATDFSDMAFSPDGRTLAILTTDHVLFFDSATGLGSEGPPLDAVGLNLCFTPDGHRVLMDEFPGNSIVAVDLDSGQRTEGGKLQSQSRVMACGVLGGEQRLAIGRIDGIELWSVDPLERLNTIATDLRLSRVVEIQLSPGRDDLMVVTSFSEVVAIGPGTTVRKWRPEAPDVRSLAASSDGSLAATGHGDGRIILWDLPVCLSGP